jgi:hypothetical protein
VAGRLPAAAHPLGAFLGTLLRLGDAGLLGHLVSRRSASRRSDCCGMSRACGRRCCQPIRQPAVDGPALLKLDDGSITLVEALAVGLDHPVTMRHEEAEEDPDGVVAVVVDVAQELRADDGTGFP